ncbi:MAG: glycosyltransferase family 2 protein [Planctomycetota bacterium]|jgi:glycosyltransferase involved in cell wall biosynthesis
MATTLKNPTAAPEAEPSLRTAGERLRLLITIPALNEETSIALTIERCLDAREQIISQSPVTDVEVTVVSDGSTDRTVEIARQYADRINLIVFERNRGYGAAITEAWLKSGADLLGFLDADGTCDPLYFSEFCRELIQRDADVVLGCRLNRDSRMPAVRRLGNKLFAWMLTVLSHTRVRDAASGMRVIRRSSLIKIFPLPTGLHFTPAMSARAVMSRDLELIEVDMPYHEREGESKLSPIRDGVRFLRVILQTALLYRPSRVLGVVAVILFALTCLMMISPTLFYLQERRVEEWMIYRFLVGELLSTIAILIWCVTYLGRKAVDISLSSQPAQDKYHGPWGWFFSRRWVWLVPAGLVLIGGWMVWTALLQFIETGHVYVHWSRFVAMMFFLSTAAIIVVCKIVDHCMNLLANRLDYLRASAERADPIPH